MARKQLTHDDNAYAGPRWKKFYPGTYQRSADWQTRQGRRNREFSTFTDLLGLNTAFDDLHRVEGESPYLRNVRYMGEKQQSQKAQVTSRSGCKLVGVFGEKDNFVQAKDAESYLELWEGRSIRFPISFTDTLTRLQLFIANTDGAKGRLRVLLKPSKNATPICDANIDLEKVGKDFEEKIVRFIQTTDKAWIQLSIMDDVEPEACSDMQPVMQRKIRILTTGYANHEAADLQLPNQDEAMRETPAEWVSNPSIPLYGVSTNTYKPVDFIIGDVSNKIIKVLEENRSLVDGQWQRGEKYTRYILAVYTDGKTNTFARVNLETGEWAKIDAHIDPQSTMVMGAKGKDYFYYVDGYSHLQRINLKTWKGELAIAKPQDVDTQTDPKKLQAQKGASLLWHARNRMYLSGFRKDPNFVQFSLINSKGDGVQYDQYNEYFYSPDQSSKETTSPITAIITDHTESALMVFREDGCEVAQVMGGLEFSTAKKIDTPLYSTGVARQHDVCVGNGSLYIYNNSEGIRRFSGADTLFQSQKVDNELRRMPANSPRSMTAHRNNVWFSFDRNGAGYADHMLIYHKALARRSPWYMDDNIPARWVLGDQESDTMYVMHATYPAVYIYGDPNTYTDFDSSIRMEYQTSYNSTGDINGWTLVRRVIAKLVANDTRTWFIGVDKDKLDDPAVWRKYVTGIDVVDNGPDAVFRNNEGYRTVTVNCFMRLQCREFNIRFVTYSWKGYSALVYTSAELGGVRSL